MSVLRGGVACPSCPGVSPEAMTILHGVAVAGPAGLVRCEWSEAGPRALTMGACCTDRKAETHLVNDAARPTPIRVAHEDQLSCAPSGWWPKCGKVCGPKDGAVIAVRVGPPL